MSFIQKKNNLYGFEAPLSNLPVEPIISLRIPTTHDFASLGRLWIVPSLNEAFVITSIVSNVANWELLATSGPSGNFTSLAVTPGLSSLSALTQVGTALINASGAGVTTIGTGGTGAVNIGNATGGVAITGATGITGASTLVGTALINASGAAVTTIGTGGTGAVHIGNATGNTTVLGTLAVTGAITSTLSITASQAVVGLQVIATGDLGNGFAAETSLTNASVVAGGTSAGMKVQTSAGAGVTASAGFLKLYLGVTPIYVPYWTQTT